MASLQEIKAQYQDVIDQYFMGAIGTGTFSRIHELMMNLHPEIPPQAINLQRFLFLALFVEKYPVAHDIVDLFVGKRLEGTVDYKDKDNAGWSPLHLVVEENDFDGAAFLLDSGADPNVEAEDGTRPINISVENENVEMTKLLMSYGADSSKLNG